MRSGKLEIGICSAFNVIAFAIPFGPLGDEGDARAIRVLTYGVALAGVAFFSGLTLSIGFFLRRQKWPFAACAFLSVTPFLATICAGQLRAELLYR